MLFKCFFFIIHQKRKFPTTTNEQQQSDSRITINVSGKIFETKQSTLDRYPNTLLSSENIEERSKYFCSQSQQFYFNRDRNKFEAILFFYQSYGKLYLPDLCSLDDFLQECDFFRIPQDAIDLLKHFEGAQLLKDVKLASRFVRPPHASSFIQKLRNVIEYPSSSTVAKIFLGIYVLLIVISVYKSCFETLPGDKLYYSTKPWMYYELALSGFLLFEFILRVALCQDLKSLLSNPFTYLDAVTVISYDSINYLVGDDINMNDDYPKASRFLKALQFLRVMRFLRLGKMSRRVSIVYVIVKDSAKDLQYFFVCLLVIVTTTGSIVFFMEKAGEYPTSMDSIPESMWWSLQAYLTLGYGDVIPTTLPGKIFSGFYMAVGILTLMLPMLSLILKLVKCTKEIKLDETEIDVASGDEVVH